jgi:hypothetical protein
MFQTLRRVGFYFRIVGFVIYITAFSLPAIRTAGPGSESNDEVGIACAIFALLPSAGFAAAVLKLSLLKDTNPGSFFLLLSGWVNLLVPIYLMFYYWPQFVRLRRVLAVSTVICVAATWMFFSESHTTPLIGHFVWVGGILMMLAPEVVGGSARRGGLNESSESADQTTTGGSHLAEFEDSKDRP